jgi:hypothetical protein
MHCLATLAQEEDSFYGAAKPISIAEQRKKKRRKRIDDEEDGRTLNFNQTSYLLTCHSLLWQL